MPFRAPPSGVLPPPADTLPASHSLSLRTVTACIFALLTLLSLHPRTSGGIFTSGAVTAYCTYLCAVAIMSDPGSSGAIAQTPRWLQAVGFAIALFALVYSTATAGGNTSAQRTFDVAPGAISGGGTDPETGEQLEPGEVHPLSYAYFHFVFSLGSMYSAMLFTSWTNANTFSAWSLDKGLASMWVKVGCGACRRPRQRTKQRMPPPPPWHHHHHPTAH